MYTLPDSSVHVTHRRLFKVTEPDTAVEGCSHCLPTVGTSLTEEGADYFKLDE